MTITTPKPAAVGPPPTATGFDLRRTGRIFGWFFIATFVFSIPARLLFVTGLDSTWSNMSYTPGAVSKSALSLGATFEFLLIVANVATAVVIYPLVKRWSATLGLGYVTARVLESVFIAGGLVAIIAVAGVDDSWLTATGVTATALETQGNALVSLYEWGFQFGPGLVVGFGNGLILGYIMYRSGLVPRRMTYFGLIGGPLLIISAVLIVFGAFENGSTASSLLALPEIVWESFLCVYCAIKGFKAVSVPAEPALV